MHAAKPMPFSRRGSQLALTKDTSRASMQFHWFAVLLGSTRNAPLSRTYYSINPIAAHQFDIFVIDWL